MVLGDEKMYVVTFEDKDNTEIISLICEKTKVAHSRANWLITQRWVKKVSIYRGGVGGEKIFQRDI